MGFDLNTAVQTTVILTGICGLFNFVILRPLRQAIEDLRSMIADVKKRDDDDRKERHMIEIKLARVEDSAKSAHHRIDTLEQQKR